MACLVDSTDTDFPLDGYHNVWHAGLGHPPALPRLRCSLIIVSGTIKVALLSPLTPAELIDSAPA